MNRYRINRLPTVALSVLMSVLALASHAQAQKAPWVGETLDGRSCTGGDPRNFGPFDYRTDKDRLPVVENRHFTPQVEQLVRGESTLHPMGDASYTLVRFPNHHRALYSAVRFSLGESAYDSLRKYPAECFLQRAIYFRPDDSVPHMLYGLYLHRLGELGQSLEKYQAAEELAPKDANLLYNMGLVYFDSGNYIESRRYAEEAYSFGIQLPGLQRKLEEAGYWD